jgi:hypothetical protein
VSQGLSKEIDQTVTKTLSFDNLGNALTQSEDKYVVSSGVLTQTTHMDISNQGIDGRGDAGVQYIATYQVSGATKTLVNYQEFTDRLYDSSHNVLNQQVFTYVDPNNKVTDFTSLSAATLSNCQEIRSSGFTTSGVAANQVIATYTDASEKTLMDVKVVANSSISSNGNVGLSIVTTYNNATISADLSTITPTGDPVSRQTITTAAANFDIHGNAIAQTVYSEYYGADPSDGQKKWMFSSYQATSNNTYDMYNRLLTSTIDNYSGQGTGFISRELTSVNESDYDQFGNALKQTVNTYSSINVTAASQTAGTPDAEPCRQQDNNELIL